jgi:hypothetical protein
LYSEGRDEFCISQVSTQCLQAGSRRINSWAVTLVTLPRVTDAATMLEKFFWRYSAVTRKNFLAALGCALLTISLLGCGGSNKLQSITLGIGGNGGFFNLAGIGGTLQLKATGNYSNSKTKDLTNVVTYSVVADGNYLDGTGLHPLNAPPLTMTLSPTGLMTAVDPAVCTWKNVEADPTKDPIWALTGSYKVTVTFQGITSQPIYVGVASSVGVDPSGTCGPS